MAGIQDYSESVCFNYPRSPEGAFTLAGKTVPNPAYASYVYRQSSGSWIQFATSIDGASLCAAAKTALHNNGDYTGRTGVTCTSTTRTLWTGGMLFWLYYEKDRKDFHSSKG